MTQNTDRYRTYVTQTGFGLEALANQQGTKVDFAKLVVGDGELPDSSNPANQTNLINQVRHYPVTIEVDDKDPTIWVARAEIPAEDGGFTIREAGVKVTDENGDLYCYARQPGDYKPVLEEGSAKSYTIRLKFIPGNASVIEAKIDPSIQFATPTDLSNAIKEHKEELNPHDQYILKKNDNGVLTAKLESGQNESSRFEMVENGDGGADSGFSIYYDGEDTNVTYIQTKQAGVYRTLAELPREVGRWNFKVPLYINEHQILDKSIVGSVSDIVGGSNSKLATGEGVIAAIAESHSNGQLSSTGYYVFPEDKDGRQLIIQWGIDNQVSGSGNGDNRVTLPIAFPNGIFMGLTTPGVIGSSAGDSVGYTGGNLTSFTYNWWSNNATGFSVNWFVLGF
ncbi:phage tail protein [Vibrio coralliilyticus]|uniref:phage tail protein n=1 Tax=Vibrio coralliilyticus TaxID=190893 RepID=UPI001E40CD45|nr:phage tail protein [Vibrio coralliilyticus]MCC2521079.1 phage tail protein [Vibrio coralliilyticus]